VCNNQWITFGADSPRSVNLASGFGVALEMTRRVGIRWLATLNGRQRTLHAVEKLLNHRTRTEWKDWMER